MKTIFGPIHSRRFGVSLGIDLSPSHKQCNFDCLYCELAPAATVETQSQTPTVEEIITDLKAALREHNNIDEITLTANGEPTLYPHLKELISEIDKIKENKETLILTNSAALVDREVFMTLLALDQVKLSLDAVTTDIFKKIDRPHEGIDISRLVEAVVEFSEMYRGKLFIEILFVRGLNDTKEEIVKLNEVLHRLKALRIDIGTIDRPPAYPVEGISYGELVAIAQQFDASLPINIASRGHAEFSQSSYTEDEIINTLDKRPLTPEDVEILFDEESKKRLLRLIEEKKIEMIERAKLEFYVPVENMQRKRKK
ncbi:MAG: radical SAM protein [Helicobacteraceae bacterium]|jgi:wyosine [tRNA(Phe)-imidazoG37] synthetase (radical SAM superfamily)|nr:radical SAM protein [Helicobacteraceae bacterium]